MWSNMVKHLKDNKMSYFQHWYRSMTMSIALFIHAWLPSVLETYASDKMKSRLTTLYSSHMLIKLNAC